MVLYPGLLRPSSSTIESLSMDARAVGKTGGEENVGWDVYGACECWGEGGGSDSEDMAIPSDAKGRSRSDGTTTCG